MSLEAQLKLIVTIEVEICKEFVTIVLHIYIMIVSWQLNLIHFAKRHIRLRHTILSVNLYYHHFDHQVHVMEVNYTNNKENLNRSDYCCHVLFSLLISLIKFITIMCPSSNYIMYDLPVCVAVI